MEYNLDSEVRGCTEFFLRNPNAISKWLNTADKHMQSYVANPELFLLAKQHEVLRPLVMAYAKDLGGFTEYLLELRGNFDRRSAEFVEIQAIYRRTNGRYVQQVRRERMGRAMEKAEALHGPVPYPTRIQWMTDVEHKWAKRRLEFLTTVRRNSGGEHLSTEDRTEALLEFWDVIDTEIHEGDLPPWN